METNQKNKGAVIVGRFQSSTTHVGYESLITESYLHSGCESVNEDMLIVIITSASPLNKRDPLSFEARQEMISKHFGISKTRVISIQENDNREVWSLELDKIIEGVFGDREIIIYGSRDSIVNNGTYIGKFPTHEIIPVILKEEEDLEMHFLDKDLVVNKIGTNKDFREGWIANIMQREPIVYSAVDIAIVTPDLKFIVLGKRKGGGDLMNFSSGFFNPLLDRTDEDTVSRVISENHGDFKVSKPVYICSSTSPDYRNPAGGDFIRTQLFVVYYQGGVIKTVNKDTFDGVGMFYTDSILDFIDDEQRYLAQNLLDFTKRVRGV